MPRGGRRPGAGRKTGSGNRSKVEIEKERAFKAFTRAARQAKADAAQEAADAAHQARQAKREARADKLMVQILPPIETPDLPAGIPPLDFLRVLMEDSRLPILFRRDCAALALPFVHPKPILGLKDARRLAAFDDDEDDDEIAAVMRGG
jgi:hypothetical protein